ncbi:hypothetical protein [Micrococcus lylae]|uniref:Uncharacterized protein n=1 Tax=Micrococcus lylae TaxID=1273 RepID=A0ABY2K2P8_9MICC|nr:hypothetical protein [Micrococcus lylae]TFI01622.1 hypothetical protein E4A49_00985 [Micrococcus lylae]
MDWGIIATVAGSIVVAVFGWRGIRDKARTDTRTAELDALLATMRATIDGLKADVASMRGELDELRKENRRLVDENALLTGRLRDKDDLLDDYRAIAGWIERGADPPTPPLSWRIQQELADHARSIARRLGGDKEH